MKESAKVQSRDVHMFIEPGTKIYAWNFNRRDSSVRNFRLEKFEDNRLVLFIEAAEARWQGPPDKWRLSNYEIHSFGEEGEQISVGGREKLDTNINLRPEELCAL